jgi:hypothetical protein
LALSPQQKGDAQYGRRPNLVTLLGVALALSAYAVRRYHSAKLRDGAVTVVGIELAMGSQMTRGQSRACFRRTRQNRYANFTA